MTLSELKNLADIIQSFIISFAALSGGLWALYQFHSLKRIEKAKSELKAIKRSLEERGILSAGVDAFPTCFQDKLFIQVRVQIENVGNTSEVINWDDSGVVASKVVKAENGIIEFSKDGFHGYQDEDVSAEDSCVDPGVKLVTSFLVHVTEPGIYFIDFAASCSPLASQNAAESRTRSGIGGSSANYSWYSDTFVVVPEYP
ncbi:hypothetical protein [uncultured Marinobacter sp.]|uniref:hypothetical protein n=1 Tax=uncultured Marinobacter sp. TaxID=187379 RepID=UPI0025F52C43|nr:hypothetical protein [uncultured Marinobacter sp.]